jgi:hypothetical protein
MIYRGDLNQKNILRDYPDFGYTWGGIYIFKNGRGITHTRKNCHDKLNNLLIVRFQKVIGQWNRPHVFHFPSIFRVSLKIQLVFLPMLLKKVTVNLLSFNQSSIWNLQILSLKWNSKNTVCLATGTYTTGNPNFPVCTEFPWEFFREHTLKFTFPCRFWTNTQENTKTHREIHHFPLCYLKHTRKLP